MKDGSVLNIPCPDPTCKEEVTPNDVRCVLDQETWEKYDNFMLMSALKQDPNICWYGKKIEGETVEWKEGEGRR
jgi:hypothetical protein